MSQEEINGLLIDLGRAGKTVVRLKGGDPYIFGRGGEEALDLLEAGIPFEVVPGVTSGVATPAYAGIPVTHRGVSTSVAFITGHEDPTKEHQDVDWSRVANAADTLVLYMGIGRLQEISAELISAGKDPGTPAACVRWGTRPDQQTVSGTLGDIAERVSEANLKPPAITVIGEVVSLREKGLDWFERRPLFGRRIVVTRARTQAGELSAMLRDLGAEVLEFPTIEIKPPEDFGPLDKAILELDGFGWLIFTSTNGVEAFAERLGHHELDARAVPRGTKIAAIGPATADRVGDFGLRVDVVPREYRAESLLEEISDYSLAGEKILIPRAKVAREILPEKLREAGAEVVVPPAYESVPSVRRDGWCKADDGGGGGRLRDLHRQLHGRKLRGGFRRGRSREAFREVQGRLYRPDHGGHSRRLQPPGGRRGPGVHYPGIGRGGGGLLRRRPRAEGGLRFGVPPTEVA